MTGEYIDKLIGVFLFTFLITIFGAIAVGLLILFAASLLNGWWWITLIYIVVALIGYLVYKSDIEF